METNAAAREAIDIRDQDSDMARSLAILGRRSTAKGGIREEGIDLNPSLLRNAPREPAFKFGCIGSSPP